MTPGDIVLEDLAETDTWRTFTVSVRNPGPEAQHVLQVTTTCGCLHWSAAFVDGDERRSPVDLPVRVKPGEGIDVIAHPDLTIPEGRGARTVWGHISVVTSDPRHPVLRKRFRADVRRRLIVTPSRAVIRSGPESGVDVTKSQASFIVEPSDADDPFRVVEVADVPWGWHADARPEDSSHRRWIVTASPDRVFPAGTHDARVRVITDIYGEAVCSARAIAEDAIRVEPAGAIVLGRIERGHVGAAPIRVTHAGGLEPVLASWRWLPDVELDATVTVTQRSAVPGLAELEVHVRSPEGNGSGSRSHLSGTLRLTLCTDTVEQEELRILAPLE